MEHPAPGDRGGADAVARDGVKPGTHTHGRTKPREAQPRHDRSPLACAASVSIVERGAHRCRAAIELLRRQAGEGCRNEGDLLAENALRGRWRMRCQSGDLLVAITLSPTEPAGVQLLEVTPLAREQPLGPEPVCR